MESQLRCEKNGLTNSGKENPSLSNYIYIYILKTSQHPKSFSCSCQCPENGWKLLDPGKKVWHILK